MYSRPTDGFNINNYNDGNISAPFEYATVVGTAIVSGDGTACVYDLAKGQSNSVIRTVPQKLTIRTSQT